MISERVFITLKFYRDILLLFAEPDGATKETESLERRQDE
jgi:hypothetical protein